MEITMALLGLRSRLVRSVLGGFVSLAIVAALAPAAEARPRKPGYAAGYGAGHAPYRRHRGGNGAALAAIAGIAAIGIGAAIASANRSRYRQYDDVDPRYGYGPARVQQRPSWSEPGYVDEPEVIYEPAPDYAPRPVYQPRVYYAPRVYDAPRAWDGGQRFGHGHPGWGRRHPDWNAMRAQQEMLDRHTRR